MWRRVSTHWPLFLLWKPRKRLAYVVGRRDVDEVEDNEEGPSEGCVWASEICQVDSRGEATKSEGIRGGETIKLLGKGGGYS